MYIWIQIYLFCLYEWISSFLFCISLLLGLLFIVNSHYRIVLQDGKNALPSFFQGPDRTLDFRKDVPIHSVNIMFFSDATKYLLLTVETDVIPQVSVCDRPYVLIATPLRDAAVDMDNYVSHLLMDSYPKSCISVGFLISDSADDIPPSLMNVFERVGAPESLGRNGTAA